VLRQSISEKEGRSIHMEAQLQDVSHDTRVEWFKDGIKIKCYQRLWLILKLYFLGQTLTASSRITTIFNFSYCSLNIMHLRLDDAGVYTVRGLCLFL
jgi:hypothetical protein